MVYGNSSMKIFTLQDVVYYNATHNTDNETILIWLITVH